MNERVALITGAASGIGRQVALRAAVLGYAVIGVDRDAEGLAATIDQIRSTGGNGVEATADVSDAQQMEYVSSVVREQFGHLDLAVAAAGVEVLGRVDELDLASWQRSIDVTLTGTFLTAKAVIESLKQARGAFVAVASDAGTTGAEGYSAYAAAKHGVVGLVRCMALDYGPYGVRSNVVCPGFVDTPMARRLFDNSPEGTEEFYQNSIPLGRFATPDDVADSVLHLAESRYANGLVYALDGGSTAGYFAGGRNNE